MFIYVFWFLCERRRDLVPLMGVVVRKNKHIFYV